MLHLSAIRWGQPYESLEVEEVTHFVTGEPVVRVSQVGSGIIKRDARQAKRARAALRELSPAQLIQCCRQAGELFSSGTLNVGDQTQSPEEFAAAQSATTGMPISMCKANMEKNAFVMGNMETILAALTRGLSLDILARGYGDEGRGVTISYQAQTPALGAVLPSNSPGVHTLWLPVIPLQIGLVLKPGSQEPWTPYRMIAAMVAAGVPAQAMSIYPGAGAEIGGAILSAYPRSMIFGGPDTVNRYLGDARVQPHGPGYSKILIGDDMVDQWETHLDLLVDSVRRNGGRSCINCSAIYASRHTEEIAAALAQRLGPIAGLPPEDPHAELAAFTNPAIASAIYQSIEAGLQDSRCADATAAYGPRLEEHERHSFLRPMVVHCSETSAPLANVEYLFPFVSVVNCPQQQMLSSIGPTLIGTILSHDGDFCQEAMDATHIDRLNLGAIPTPAVDWLQPHEGNLVEFLYRNRALQTTAP